MLSCIIALCYGFYLLAQQQANPNQEEAKHASINKANQTFTSSTHYIQSSEAQTKGQTAKASHLYKGGVSS
jgi:uncharacterized protein HemX